MLGSRCSRAEIETSLAGWAAGPATKAIETRWLGPEEVFLWHGGVLYRCTVLLRILI